MSEDNVETKIPKLLLVSKESVEKEDFSKFMDPQVVKDENAAPEVDWLQNWLAFRFINMSDVQITEMQNSIVIWTRGLLADFDANNPTGPKYYITRYEWVPRGTNTYSLEAYLFPPARVVPSDPGTAAVLDPKSPRQPPPPSL